MVIESPSGGRIAPSISVGDFEVDRLVEGEADLANRDVGHWASLRSGGSVGSE